MSDPRASWDLKSIDRETAESRTGCAFELYRLDGGRILTYEELADELTEEVWNNPEATAADVPGLLRDRIVGIAAENGKDLAAEAAWIEHTVGNPWEFAAHDQTDANRVRAVARQAEAARPTSDHGFAAWWEQVSGSDNVVANFRYLPDAWDGALNSQKAHGNLHYFDVEPLFVTYSTIGMPGPEDD